MMLHSRFGHSQIFLIWKQPFLIRVLERGRKRRHDFATVAEIAPDLSPSFGLAHMVEATLSLNRLFQAIQIQWAFVNAWESIE